MFADLSSSVGALTPVERVARLRDVEAELRRLEPITSDSVALARLRSVMASILRTCGGVAADIDSGELIAAP